MVGPIGTGNGWNIAIRACLLPVFSPENEDNAGLTTLRYEQTMSETVMNRTNPPPAGNALRQELARGDVALAGVAPVLSHLLASPGQSLVTEDVLARMRGMLGDLAAQLIKAEKSSGATAAVTSQAELAGRLAASGIIVSHVYALAMESQLADQLEQQSAIDQVLTPLLQELIASTDEGTAELAMSAMSAQARFVQAQRRMDLPLGELPAELFVEVLSIWRNCDKGEDQEERGKVEKALRSKYDESTSRLGLMSRLIGSLSGGIRAALDLEHAGLALFASALASTGRQARELAVLSCHEKQAARLALALRSAGLKRTEIAQQFILIHRDLAVPAGIDDIAPDEAARLIKGTASGRGN